MFALATPVQFGSGWIFYKEALSGLRHRKLGMAAMVVLGTTAAWYFDPVLVTCENFDLTNKKSD